ncbi:protein serine/threonine phosphatase Ecym_4610 [Eremothecium cymbalariae DBVPG|uniref:RNA polymerase II subunit A C-terminal domain phosphatase n=1 Tax=Eremothecium cymbalariae (strain CBS 270.75 / DBVPG 7215 / KCTC 17166 / NRRL Y-17582) TaxID=931890 RepID=G8JSB7_ERECY|nr:hypothetical protein Ecym_4610 [Eremothecium cymbalariae DBVPG\
MSTPIRLPDNLPYPITVAQLAVSAGDMVERGQRLFAYKYWDFEQIVTSPGDESAGGKSKRQRIDLVGTFDSPVSGQVVSLNITLGDEFVNSQCTVAEIKQPCTHDVTYGGLCVQCGQTVEDEQTSGSLLDNQAKLTMSHTNMNIRISEKQAYTLEKSAQKQLREARKLVLVVDLDQTVIHCGVDPTIGEWSKDPDNPNYESLKDVRSFSLHEEPVLPPFYMGPKPPTRKCWYYVKLRPGLQDFFSNIAPHFELHIYTMATRTYALEIAKIIDPDGTLFGDRILSRDENGSLTQKSLERLFPMDQSMVVIIDDRGDVWNWCENLIKVVPYDFFVGIGDINSNFLPRQQNSMLHLGRRNRKKLKQDEELLTDILDTEKKLKVKISEEVKRQEEEMQKLSEEKIPDHTTSKEDIAKKLEHNASLEVQQQNRPLAELQKHLHNERLLIDDDDELPHLTDILLRVHSAYYDQLEKNKHGATELSPDIKHLIPSLKEIVFKGCNFVFSGLIPLHTNIDRADIVLWTNTFGAKTTINIDYNTTHLITKTPGTMKARLASSFNRDIKIVHPDWIFECIVNWKRVDEKPYELIVEEPVSKEYLENFKKELEETEKSKNSVDANISSQKYETFNDAMILLGGSDSWLDNDDEMDEFLNDSDSEDHRNEGENGGDKSTTNSHESVNNIQHNKLTENLKNQHIQQNQKPLSRTVMETKDKRPLDEHVGSDEAPKVKRQHISESSIDWEEEDDLEAELLHELEQ